jgi:WD40 repeat protein
MLVSSSFDQNLVVWDVANSVQKFSLKVFSCRIHQGEIESSNGHALVVQTIDLFFMCWFQGHNGWVNDAAFSKDQKWVLSCSQVCFINDCTCA